jgi:hypothetical protein
MTTGRINQVAIPSEPKAPRSLRTGEHSETSTTPRASPEGRSARALPPTGPFLPRIATRTGVATMSPRRARRVPGRIDPPIRDPLGPREPRRLSPRPPVRGRVRRARARAPLGAHSKKWRDAAQRPGSVAPRGAPLRRGAWLTFVLPDVHGRDRDSASDGVAEIPPHSLAFRPECNPFDRHRAPRRAGPLGSPEESFGRDREH